MDFRATYIYNHHGDTIATHQIRKEDEIVEIFFRNIMEFLRHKMDYLKRHKFDVNTIWSHKNLERMNENI